MPYRAKCKVCSWRCQSAGENFIRLASRAHVANTGHSVKIKSKEA